MLLDVVAVRERSAAAVGLAARAARVVQAASSKLGRRLVVVLKIMIRRRTRAVAIMRMMMMPGRRHRHRPRRHAATHHLAPVLAHVEAVGMVLPRRRRRRVMVNDEHLLLVVVRRRRPAVIVLVQPWRSKFAVIRGRHRRAPRRRSRAP